MHVLHEDPFTWRAFSKPRGYAGDASFRARGPFSPRAAGTITFLIVEKR
jgi:hypothetical protein